MRNFCIKSITVVWLKNRNSFDMWDSVLLDFLRKSSSHVSLAQFLKRRLFYFWIGFRIIFYCAKAGPKQSIQWVITEVQQRVTEQTLSARAVEKFPSIFSRKTWLWYMIRHNFSDSLQSELCEPVNVSKWKSKYLPLAYWEWKLDSVAVERYKGRKDIASDITFCVQLNTMRWHPCNLVQREKRIIPAIRVASNIHTIMGLSRLPLKNTIRHAWFWIWKMEEYLTFLREDVVSCCDTPSLRIV